MRGSLKLSNKRLGLKNINWLDLTWILILPIININYVLAASISNNGRKIATLLDKKIPFISVFIIPYIYWYLYIMLGLIFILSKNRNKYLRLLLSIYIGMIVCYFFYYLFPVEIRRPYIADTNILNKLVNMIYDNDRPVNCFPSIHVLNTYLIMRFTSRKDGKLWFYYTNIIGILIILSTFFIKQHYILDGMASILLSEMIILINRCISDKYFEKLLSIPYKFINRKDDNKNIFTN